MPSRVLVGEVREIGGGELGGGVGNGQRFFLMMLTSGGLGTLFIGELVLIMTGFTSSMFVLVPLHVIIK